MSQINNRQGVPVALSHILAIILWVLSLILGILTIFAMWEILYSFAVDLYAWKQEIVFGLSLVAGIVLVDNSRYFIRNYQQRQAWYRLISLLGGEWLILGLSLVIKIGQAEF